MTLATTVSGILGRIAELKTFESCRREMRMIVCKDIVVFQEWCNEYEVCCGCASDYKFGKIRWLMYRGSIELIGQSTSILRGLEKFARDLVGKSDRGLSRVVSQEFRTNVRGSRNNWFTRSQQTRCFERLLCSYNRSVDLDWILVYCVLWGLYAAILL